MNKYPYLQTTEYFNRRSHLEECERERDGEAALDADEPHTFFVGAIRLRIVGARELSRVPTDLAAAHH